MLLDLDVTKVLFLDIESRSKYKTLEELKAASPEWVKFFEKKVRSKIQFTIDNEAAVGNKEQALEFLYQNKAPLYAEFGKVICITVGFIHSKKDGQNAELRVFTFQDEDEAVLLEKFALKTAAWFKKGCITHVCGQAIRGFDIPFIVKRLILNKIKVPPYLNVCLKKPWNTKHILDTMTIWAFDGYERTISLDFAALLFGIPSPKEDLSGAEVRNAYWVKKDIPSIVRYCEKDVFATCKFFLNSIQSAYADLVNKFVTIADKKAV